MMAAHCPGCGETREPGECESCGSGDRGASRASFRAERTKRDGVWSQEREPVLADSWLAQLVANPVRAGIVAVPAKGSMTEFELAQVLGKPVVDRLPPPDAGVIDAHQF
jgi:hypothetical protein